MLETPETFAHAGMATAFISPVPSCSASGCRAPAGERPVLRIPGGQSLLEVLKRLDEEIEVAVVQPVACSGNIFTSA